MPPADADDDALDRLLSVQAIERLGAEYCHGADKKQLDGDRAAAESDVTTMSLLPGGTWLFSGGTYLDEAARRDGEWRLVRRSARVHFSLPVAAPSAEGKGFEPLSTGTPR